MCVSKLKESPEKKRAISETLYIINSNLNAERTGTRVLSKRELRIASD